jgi:DNA-binding CsgD family transcriptional regulator/tetratricopeptide (TPR) repeat protein
MGKPPTFIGRKVELASLGADFAQARQGNGGVILVTGDLGIGKTRLAEEFARIAAGDLAIVARGRFYESLESAAYTGIRESLLTLLQTDEVRYALDTSSPYLSALTTLAPEFAEVIGPDPVAAAASADQYRLWRGIAEVITTAARLAPVLVFIDDLHWADSGTFGFLRFFGEELRISRVLFVATLRRDEAQERVSELTTHLRRTQTVKILHVDGLSKRDVGAMATDIADRDVSADLVEAIHGQSQGNPLFVEELVRNILSGPSGGGELPDPAELEVPAGIRDLMQRRLSRLRSKCAELLRVMAVVGRECDLGLAILVMKSDRAGVLASVDEGISADVIREAQDGRLVFSHPLMRTVIYRDMPLSDRLTMHLEVAEAMAGRRGRNAANTLELAHHIAAASEIADPREVAEQCLAGARQARLLFSFDEGSMLANEALSALDRLSAEDPVLRGQVLTELGYAENGLGRPEAALLRYTEALRVYREVGDVGGSTDVRRWLVSTLLQQGRAPEALSISRAGLVEAAEERADRYHGLVAGHSMALMFTGAITEAGPWVQKSLDIAFDDVTTANANHVAGGWNAWGGGDRQAATACFRAASESLVAGGWDSTAAGIEGDHMVAAYFLGEFEESARAQERAARLASSVGRVATITDLHAFRSLKHVHRGAWEVAEQEFAAWQDATNELGAGTLYGHIARRSNALKQLWMRGPGDARPVLDMSFALDLPLLPMLAVEGSDAAAARTGLGILQKTIPAQGRGLLWMGAALPIVTVMCSLRDEAVTEWYTPLQEYSGCIFDWFMVDLELARISALERRWEDAEGHLEEARDLCLAQELRPFLAQAHHQQGLLYLERRSAGDRARAYSHLEQALAVSQELGMDHLSSKTRELIATPRRGRPSGQKSHGLTERELTVVRLLADGKSNRMIAETLYVTEKTVEHHLSRIYSKLNVTGRGEAGAFAVRNGLLDGR